MGYRQFGASLFWYTFMAIISLAIAVSLIPYPQVTNDKLLVASFGGFFWEPESDWP